MIKISHEFALENKNYSRNFLRSTNRSNALETPSFSIGSLVIRNPAVSQITTGYPPMSIVDSITSRVVPGIGETIAVGFRAENIIEIDLR
jgi:hypothetical protein